LRLGDLGAHGRTRCKQAPWYAERRWPRARSSGVPRDIAVAITGVAGPEPDEDGNPVGLVYVGMAARWADTDAVECRFGERSRAEIRDLSMECALKRVETVLARRLEADGGRAASVFDEKAS
jgi:hypothetical protein